MPAKIVDEFQSKRILVVGDVMLDEYILGKVDRISPEAPVPVFEVLQRYYSLGGAGNVAKNIVSFGGMCELVGVIGHDNRGRMVLELCGQSNIVSHFHMYNDRPTTTKSRVISCNQQLLRMDEECTNKVPDQVEWRFINFFDEQIDRFHACVLSDYAKGMLSKNMLQSLTKIGKMKHVPVIVDPKGMNYAKYFGATVLTPNKEEVYQAIPDKTMTLNEAAHFLQNVAKPEALLITQGEEGMSLYVENSDVMSLPSTAQYVKSVVGAGDTVVAVLALSLASGASITKAAMLANCAAGIVVEKSETDTISLSEFRSKLELLQFSH